MYFVVVLALLLTGCVTAAADEATPTPADLAACFQYASAARQETEAVRARLEIERAFLARERDALKAELAATKKATP